MINSLNKKILIAISLFFLSSCSSDNDFTSEDEELSSDYIISNEVLDSEDSEDYFENAELVSSDPSIDENYFLEDINTSYQYEDRTGTVGDYTYNYDVSGQDSFGDEVVGNIDISGKYGNGTITDSEGDEKNIDVEWTDYGILEATDDYGNTYEMEVQ
ncbi:hypothetical protein FHS24_001014 [Psychrobacter luti]|uniref:Uncharacterized protein n=1 Tax=Psychrobacter luti TaxID=198481 RepID=A0A839TG29_9GAMM|nr:hypothetical protein [Psychrobacter luti]MBB3106513.1 hypothetical protein [Psychrobacter luti]